MRWCGLKSRALHLIEKICESLKIPGLFNKYVGEMTFGETTWHREQHLLLLGRRLRFHPEQKKAEKKFDPETVSPPFFSPLGPNVAFQGELGS